MDNALLTSNGCPPPEKFVGLDPLPFERESLGYTPKDAHQQAAVDDEGLCEQFIAQPFIFSVPYLLAGFLITYSVTRGRDVSHPLVTLITERSRSVDNAGVGRSQKVKLSALSMILHRNFF